MANGFVYNSQIMTVFLFLEKSQSLLYSKSRLLLITQVMMFWTYTNVQTFGVS